MGQYGTDCFGLWAVSYLSQFLNFGLGLKEIRFSRALISMSWYVSHTGIVYLNFAKVVHTDCLRI